MALRYRTEFAENGNVADPRWWLTNQVGYVGEFSRLDRDNIAQNVVVEDSFLPSVCNRVVADPKTDTVTLDDTITSWQYTSGGTEIHNVTTTINQSALCICEWSGTIKWTDVTGDMGWDSVVVDGSTVFVWDCVKVHIVADGVVVASTGWLAAGQSWTSPMLVGAVPVEAGSRNVRVEARCARIVFAVDSVYSCVINVPTLTQRELVVRYRKR